MGSPADTVREMYAAFARRDVGFVMARLSPDIIWEGWADHSAQRAGIAWVAERRGHAAVEGFFALTAEFNDEAFEVDAILEGGGLEGVGAAGLVTGFRQDSDTAKLVRATRGTLEGG